MIFPGLEMHLTMAFACGIFIGAEGASLEDASMSVDTRRTF